jgi:hypothetical protein
MPNLATKISIVQFESCELEIYLFLTWSEIK